MQRASLPQRLAEASVNSADLMAQCHDVALTCARFEGQIQALQAEMVAATTRRDGAGQDVIEIEQAMAVLQGLESAWKKNFEAALADIVSRGLSLVFGEPMKVEIISDISRGASSVGFQLTTGEGEQTLSTAIIGARGGSVVEVASFLFRVLLVLSSRPPLRKIIVIDESFRMVADENIPALAQMIRHLADHLGIQIVLVTHMHAFADAADVVYEVTAARGCKIPTARVRRIKSRNDTHE
jgi:hypothetical protein